MAPSPHDDSPQERARRHLDGGTPAEAVSLLRAMVDAGDTRITVVHDLIRAHLAAGDQPAALTLMQRLATAVPDRADIQLQFAGLLHHDGRVDDALAVCVAAARRCPDDVDVWRSIDRRASQTGRHRMAFDACRRVCALAPREVASWRRLGITARRARENAVADEAIDRWYELDPTDPTAAHLHAAHHGGRPDRADPRYVAALFDSYADGFDEHLGKLGYRTPEAVAALVARLLEGADGAGAGVGAVIAADLGCGTGQVGVHLRALVGHLVGVDLSAGMLAKAHQRGCYDRLEQAELTEFLVQHPATFRLLTSADTLNYIGDLHPVFVAAATALLPGGHLVFSLEAGEREPDDGYRLEPSGRYAHSPEWTRRALATAGFAEVSVEGSVLRREGDVDVAGLLFVARLPGTGNSPG